MSRYSMNVRDVPEIAHSQQIRAEIREPIYSIITNINARRNHLLIIRGETFISSAINDGVVHNDLFLRHARCRPFALGFLYPSILG